MPKVVMNIRYVSKRAIIAMAWHEQHRTPDGASAIDPSRSHMNRVIRGPKTQEQALDKLFKEGVKKPTAQAETPYVQMVLSASPEYFRDEGQGPGQWNDRKMKEWGQKSFQWLKAEYGDDLIHVALHLDEDTPHLHALIVPTYERKARMPGRRKRNETQEEFEDRKREAENAPTTRTVGRSSNEKWRKSFARHDARISYHKAVESLGIEYGQDFLGEALPSPEHKLTGTFVKEQASQNARDRKTMMDNARRWKMDELKKFDDMKAEAETALAKIRRIFKEFKKTFPAVRRVLQFADSTPEMLDEAKKRRKDIVQMVPFMRRLIKDQVQHVDAVQSATTEKTLEDSSGPSF